MPTEPTWHQAIMHVLEAASEPLHYNEIADRVLEGQLKSTAGATPAATVNALINTSIKQQGKESPYIRVAKGIFTLSAAVNNKSAVPTAAKMSEFGDGLDDVEPQYSIITSFGMFWRRDAVRWVSSPLLKGQEKFGSTPVDFNKQLGIYLLYDGREVIYIGRTTDRALGRRLYEHTRDRLASRWDRFSWFGFLPITEQGVLMQMPVNYDSTKIIPAFEAVLIESLEPRQNRKQGDGLSSVEFMLSTPIQF